jgi:hypothetical protein
VKRAVSAVQAKKIFALEMMRRRRAKIADVPAAQRLFVIEMEDYGALNGRQKMPVAASLRSQEAQSGSGRPIM